MLDSERHKSVLLVEDDPSYMDLLREAFEEAGFRTSYASNGEKAIEQLRRQEVDLVVSDFMMPELNGLELCRLMNEDPRLSRVKVVVYSCNTDGMFRKKARDLGAAAFVAKNEDAKKLVNEICDLTGILTERAASPQPVQLVVKKEKAQSSLSKATAQIDILVDSMLHFLKIAGSADALPEASRLALESAEHAGCEVKSLAQAVTQAADELVEATIVNSARG